jgi:hypothetical protein
MLMHAAVAATDATRALAGSNFGAAAALFRRSVAQSLWALIEEAPRMRRLARRRKRTVANAAILHERHPSPERSKACRQQDASAACCCQSCG